MYWKNPDGPRTNLNALQTKSFDNFHLGVVQPSVQVYKAKFLPTVEPWGVVACWWPNPSKV